MARRSARTTAFVPRIVFSMAIAGVIPSVATSGCGDDKRTHDDDDGTGGFAGVAAVAMGGFGGVAAVAMGGFGGVAAVAMGGFGGGGPGGAGGTGGAGGAGGAGGSIGGGGSAAFDPAPSGIDSPWRDPVTVARSSKKASRAGRSTRKSKRGAR